ncbi:hypothetical protein QYF61_011216 [Mycteria americana]|uniref:Uncharacterized protein n=1 Tax=Mycteria americana TaxID=33587 RepID=A0AAN7PCJ8_MYCAM|nr:hypothetical protein QYF61_011216 [Mycteria americana]
MAMPAKLFRTWLSTETNTNEACDSADVLRLPVRGTGSKLNMSQQRALTAKEANSIPGCVNRGRGSRWRGGIIPLRSALIRPHLEYRVVLYISLPASTGELEHVQQRANKMVKAGALTL